jgi:hypothetical protein
MPEQKPGPAPDESTPSWSTPPKVWETGVTPDESRVPGTRRLWLAGGLAVGVLIASVSAIALQDRDAENEATDRTGRTSSADEPLVPGVSVPPAAPSAKTGLSSPQADSSKDGSSSEKQQGGAKDEPESDSSKSSSGKDDKGGDGDSGDKDEPESPSKPSDRKSVKAVNYPDRYWHVSDGLVRLDPLRGSESREDSTFTVVKGLSKSSCYSFKTADGTYLRHRNFVLRSERNDGSSLFSQDATFCPVYSGHPGAVMLQSVNYPNHVLRHRNFQLRLDPYGYNTTNREDFSFRLVDGVA